MYEKQILNRRGRQSSTFRGTYFLHLAVIGDRSNVVVIIMLNKLAP